MSKALEVFEKLAAKKDKKKKSKKKKKSTYPISRGIGTYGSMASLGLNRAIQQRAVKGRAAIGAKGLTHNEELVLKNVKVPDNDSRTYPISRALTSPAVGAGMMGAQYGVLGKMMGARGAGLGAMVAGGAALGAAGTALTRGIHARANVGRSRKGRSGTLPSDRSVLESLRKSKV